MIDIFQNCIHIGFFVVKELYIFKKPIEEPTREEEDDDDDGRRIKKTVLREVHSGKAVMKSRFIHHFDKYDTFTKTIT